MLQFSTIKYVYKYVMKQCCKADLKEAENRIVVAGPGKGVGEEGMQRNGE